MADPKLPNTDVPLTRASTQAVEEFKMRLAAETEFFDGLSVLMASLLKKVGSRNRLFMSVQRLTRNYINQ